MEREQQIELCRVCSFRQKDIHQGLLCKKTGKKADFEKECPDYILDKSAKPTTRDDEEALDLDEIQDSIDPKLLQLLKEEGNFKRG